MGVEELTVVVNFAREVGVLLARGLEYDLGNERRIRQLSPQEPSSILCRTLEPFVSLCDAR